MALQPHPRNRSVVVFLALRGTPSAHLPCLDSFTIHCDLTRVIPIPLSCCSTPEFRTQLRKLAQEDDSGGLSASTAATAADAGARDSRMYERFNN
jgi:hypothetical protein